MNLIDRVQTVVIERHRERFGCVCAVSVQRQAVTAGRMTPTSFAFECGRR